MFLPTPLAWYNLTHDLRRMMLTVGGVGFAVALMFMQQGFELALIDSTALLIDAVDGDLIMVSKSQDALFAQQKFVRTRLFQAERVPGVAWARPLYIEIYQGVLKTPETRGYPIRVLACDPQRSVFRSELSTELARSLNHPQTALFDSLSKRKFRAPQDPQALAEHPFTLAGRPVRFVGQFALGTDFASDGNVILSERNFAVCFPFRGGGLPLSQVDMGVIRLAPGADPVAVRDAIRANLSPDVRIETIADFRESEIKAWRRNTPVGVIFAIGMAMGFIVGVVICYQIIYTDISEHMAEFATLKALGYPDRYFYGVVVCEAVYLSLLGFIPGIIASYIAFQFLASWTGLPLIMTVGRAAYVYGLTLVMCLVSGFMAVRKLLGADPAPLF